LVNPGLLATGLETMNDGLALIDVIAGVLVAVGSIVAAHAIAVRAACAPAEAAAGKIPQLAGNNR
jgi:hypothetical protein